MNVKIVGSWKNDEQKNVIDDLKNHEIDSWSKKKQWKKKIKACEKKIIGEKNRKEKEKASRKSQ